MTESISDSLGIHRQPLTREDSCETHGPFKAESLFAGFWSRCPACEDDQTAVLDEAARIRAETVAIRQREAAALKWMARMEAAGVPDRFRSKTLDSFIARTPPQVAALDFSRTYVEDFDDVLSRGRGAVFFGKPGTGKTHLAVGIGMAVMRDRQKSFLFTTVMRAVRRIKDSWAKGAPESEGQAVRAFTQPDLLVLDEVGIQFGSEFEKNLIFDILNERYERRRPTLLISNLVIGEVEAYLGERVMDRLREDGGRAIPFNWESQRGVR